MKEALPDKPDDDFTAFSCILFGDQDYPANTHRNYMSMSIIQHLFQEVGFIDIVTAPYGDLQTDLILEARKPVSNQIEEWEKLCKFAIFSHKVHGFDVLVTDGGYIGKAIKEDNYEPLNTEAFNCLIKEGDFVIDVGANFGYYTLLFSKIVGPRGKVIAFEPHPGLFKLLEYNIKHNYITNVELHNIAIGEAGGSTTLYLHNDNAGDSRNWLKKNEKFVS